MLKKLVGTIIAAAAAAAAFTPAAATAEPVSVGAGDEVFIRHTDGRADSGCTLGFVFKGSDSEPRALVAGHCGDLHDSVETTDGRLIGRIAAVEYRGSFDSRDTALVSFHPGVAVDSRIPGVGAVSGVISREEIERATPVLCKLGVATGLNCGPITDDVQTPATMIAFLGSNDHGDSGSPVWTYGTNGEILAIGTLAGGPIGNPDVTYVEPIAEYVKAWQLN
ncbi:MAG: hypothetical protein WAW17_14555 [Rhodococcus sp. (in: high G+C Gram-positive bacteria)]|uniref:hypothetical protein n=1 Tax=Rhodococcus sp. TaxID=1831 RepID=UPI003BAE549C